jgi:imidazolonepropionase-like amidohydrolase
MRCALRVKFWLTAALTFSAVSLLAGSRVSAQGGVPEFFAIRGATVVPVSGPKMEDATLVVAHGVITELAKDASIPPEAWVIEGKGLIVYPGLFDSFSDIGMLSTPAGSASERGERPAQAARGPEDRPGSTPWRDAAGEASLTDKRISTWRDAGFTTVMSAPKGGIFPGQGAILDLAGERDGDMVVKTPVALPISLKPVGSDYSFPVSLMGTIGYVHQVWLDTDWSTKAETTYDKHPRGVARPSYDRTNSALAEALEDHALVMIPANNAVQIRRALKLADTWHVNAVIYGAQMAYEVPGEIAAAKLPVLVDLKWPEADKDSDPGLTPSLRTLRFRDRAPSSPAALSKAGVKFAFYSGGIPAPADIITAAKKAIDAGLAPDAALRALTLTPAEIFGVSDRLGSIEVGKIANLVICDGDLFDEKTKIKQVFVDGKKFEVRQPEKPKDPPKGDLTGTWKLAYDTPEGAERSTAELTMASDGTLTGTVSGPRGTATLITGYLSADHFTFTINLPIQDVPADVIFSGTFDGTALKGVISVQGLTLDFTGSKPSAPGVATPKTIGSANVASANVANGEGQ